MPALFIPNKCCLFQRSALLIPKIITKPPEVDSIPVLLTQQSADPSKQIEEVQHNARRGRGLCGLMWSSNSPQKILLGQKCYKGTQKINGGGGSQPFQYSTTIQNYKCYQTMQQLLYSYSSLLLLHICAIFLPRFLLVLATMVIIFIIPDSFLVFLENKQVT